MAPSSFLPEIIINYYFRVQCSLIACILKLQKKTLFIDFVNFKKIIMDVFSKVNKWLVWGMGIVFAMGFQSCLDDDNDNWYGKVIPNALVTVKNVDDGSFFLQLDDSTTLLPINVASSPFGEKEVRALVNYDEVDEVSGRYSKAVHINWIDSILTKPIAPDLGEENDVVYGTDPVEIVRDWVTIAEDGSLQNRMGRSY